MGNATMKTSLQFLIGCLLMSAARAEFRIWTRNDGKTAELELVSVTDAGGEKTAEFKMRGGGIPNLVLTDLEGNLIKTSYEGKKYVGPTVVMNHLESLLKK